MGAKRELWDDYRETWAAFARKLDELQELVDSGGHRDASAAFVEVEKARLRHNAARDRLAQYLNRRIADSNSASPKAPSVGDEERIRRTARLLWEFSGKPEHTAESDWRRAEDLVRSASSGS